MHACTDCGRTSETGARFHKDRYQSSGLKSSCVECLKARRKARRDALAEIDPQALERQRARNAERMRDFRMTEAGKAAELRRRTLPCYHRYRVSEKAKEGAKRRRKKYQADGLATKWQARYRALKKFREIEWGADEVTLTKQQERAALAAIEDAKMRIREGQR